MKHSYAVKDGQARALAKALADRFGCPRCFEELVIYERGPARKRVAITRERMRVSWDMRVEEGVERRQKQFSMPSENVKDKLDFILDGSNHECDIGICTVLQYADRRPGIALSLKNDTFVQSILVVETPDNSEALDGNLDFVARCREDFAAYLDDDLPSRIASIDRLPETCLKGNSEGLTISPRITAFCTQNGIVNPLGKPYSYERLKQSKSNDFSKLETLFQTVSGFALLYDQSLESSHVIQESVSIIIPCFNTEKTIERVLRAIEGQSKLDRILGGVEIILVDDGSSARIGDLISGLSLGIPTHVITMGTNSGVSAARKMGLSYASGEIVIFMDSDVILSESYVYDHALRNSILGDAVFISFKENVAPDFMLAECELPITIGCPDYSRDIRVSRRVSKDILGMEDAALDGVMTILEESDYFKALHGSREFGKLGLASMIIGHNFTGRRDNFERADPFSNAFQGWGLEDVYLGLRAIASGMFVIPVLSSGVYHIDHPVRSGTEEAKRLEFDRNQRLISHILAQPADHKIERRDRVAFDAQEANRAAQS